MTPAPQKEYIITEKLLQELVYADISSGEKEDIADKIRLHTATSAEQALEELRQNIEPICIVKRQPSFRDVYIDEVDVKAVIALVISIIKELEAELRAQRGERER